MGNLLGTSTSTRACNQSIVDAKIKYWGDPNFRPTVGPQLGRHELLCVQPTKQTGQAGFTNSSYFGGLGGTSSSGGYAISEGALRQQRNNPALGSNCR